MDRQPQITRRHDPYRIAKAIVRLWPEPLRGEAKLAFEDLCDMAARIGAQSIVVTPAELASKQGRGDAAGRRYLKSLQVEGIIDIRDKGGGRWLCDLNDPREVVAARRVVIGDVQLEMFGDELSGLDAGSAAPHEASVADATGDGLSGPAHIVRFPGRDAPSTDGASEVNASDVTPPPTPGASSPQAPVSLPPQAPPALAPPPTASRALNLGTSDCSNSLLTSVTSEAPSSQTESEVPKTSREGRRVGGSSTSDESITPPPPTLGDALKSYFDRPAPPQPSKADLELEILRIRREVNDPRLKTKPIVRVAEVVVDGRLPVREVNELIFQLNEADRRGDLKRDNCPRFAYFVGAMRDRIFPNYGLLWPKLK